MLDKFSKSADTLISGWRSCGGCGMTVSTPSCAVVTLGGDSPYVDLFLGCQIMRGVTVNFLFEQ